MVAVMPGLSFMISSASLGAVCSFSWILGLETLIRPVSLAHLC